MPAQILWPVSSSPPPLRDKEVHVWAASLDLAPPALNGLAELLSEEERERATRFKFEKHRNRFVAGRGFMRDTLGRYLQIAPEKVEFTYNSRGKPALSPSRSGRGLHFNLAHSEDLALLAITSVGAIGADVESIRPVKDVDDLVARFFSPRESELFQKLPDKQKPPAFFNLWTRKEALLKATGQGITGSLSEVEVAFLPGEEARVLAMSGAPETATRWMLRELVPASGFVGAVAIETAGQVSILSLKCFGYGAGTMCQSVQ